ncbi:MAG TPA: IS110 family transposase [Steroidobacteraceae bacterium]|jgi:transposase|nr:IS110 family transposase [Steroidobacteraceae bacterium]
MKQIKVLGIDLGKSAFHVHGTDEAGRTVIERRFTRTGLRSWLMRLQPCLIGMETCSGAHHWGRWLGRQGHQVRLMNPRYVKAYVKTNKNDARDAEAIAEAVSRPQMRFASLKTVGQQEELMVHRVRSRLVADRTALANQIRGFLQEFGIAVAQGIRVLRRRLPEILEEADSELGPKGRQLIEELREELVALDARVQELDERVQSEANRDERCRRLQEVPGIGPLTASALVATIGEARDFKSGRDLAAWLGLVPRQHSTGGVPRLLGISKRGDRYVRTLLVHGARAALRVAEKRDDRHSRWALAVQKRRGRNVAIVALANKMARIVWAIWTGQRAYAAA